MLKGKIALVTGSTRGIGAATATALATQGCHVMLNGFGEADEIERQRAALADQHGVTVAYHGADLADLSQIEALMRQTREELGALPPSDHLGQDVKDRGLSSGWKYRRYCSAHYSSNLRSFNEGESAIYCLPLGGSKPSPLGDGFSRFSYPSGIMEG
jgi:hypothetical protein